MCIYVCFNLLVFGSVTLHVGFLIKCEYKIFSALNFVTHLGKVHRNCCKSFDRSSHTHIHWFMNKAFYKFVKGVIFTQIQANLYTLSHIFHHYKFKSHAKHFTTSLAFNLCLLFVARMFYCFYHQ